MNNSSSNTVFCGPSLLISCRDKNQKWEKKKENSLETQRDGKRKKMISDGWWIFGERWIAGGCPISFYPFFSCVLVFTSNPQNNKRSCIFLDLLGVQKMLLDRLSMLDMAFTEQ